MLREVDETLLLHGSAFAFGVDWEPKAEKLLTVENSAALLDNVSDEKLARDVDELAAIFEGLVEEAELTSSDKDAPDAIGDVPSEWISELEKDALNIDEISAAFEILAEEQKLGMVEPIAVDDSECDASEASEDEDMEDAEEDEEDEEDQTTVDRGFSVRIVPCAPAWAATAPLDPRSCIRTPVFKDLDSRIPRVQIPRIDLYLPAQRLCIKSSSAPVAAAVHLSPKVDKVKSVYRHDPSTCWICKSDKSPERKRALHRYHDKRTRRNWKKGPRCTGRSKVASSRVRDGGRFICTARWI